MNDGKRRKRGFHDGAELFKTFDFAIESAVSDGKKQAFRHLTARGLSPVSCPGGNLVLGPYNFGDPITATLTFNNKTLASMGLGNPASYVYTVGSGLNTDTVTFNFGGGAAVPEPSSLAVFSIAAAAAAIRARRKAKAKA